MGRGSRKVILAYLESSDDKMVIKVQNYVLQATDYVQRSVPEGENK